jgi:hypothetical protein
MLPETSTTARKMAQKRRVLIEMRISAPLGGNVVRQTQRLQTATSVMPPRIRQQGYARLPHRPSTTLFQQKQQS